MMSERLKDMRDLLRIYSKPGAQKLDDIIRVQVEAILNGALSDLKDVDSKLGSALEDEESLASFAVELDDANKKLIRELATANVPLQNVKEAVHVELENLGSQISTVYDTKDGEGGREP